MPGTPARLYYDPGCGPCRFFARVAGSAGRGRLEIRPFDGGPAEEDLGGLDPTVRFAYAHLVAGGRIATGADIMLPLLGSTVGPSTERILRRIPPAERGLADLYGLFWRYRRAHGCAARPGGGGSGAPPRGRISAPAAGGTSGAPAGHHRREGRP